MNRQRLLNRFLQYVRIDTTANEQTSNYPSTPGQLELGRLLLEQLRELGLADAGQNAHGIVTATVPGNLPGAPPVVAFNAHVDTSPETTGAGVQPQV
ncbi:MAG: peptidase T, partial [Planctomycetota bacterium]